MKKINFTIGRMLIGVAVLLCGCSKSDSSTPTVTNPYGGNNGQVTFWCSNVNASVYPVTISINGNYVGTIGGMTTTTPDCDNAANNVVKYVATPGTYNMYAKSANNGNWSGTVTITNGHCLTQQLQ